VRFSPHTDEFFTRPRRGTRWRRPHGAGQGGASVVGTDARARDAPPAVYRCWLPPSLPSSKESSTLFGQEHARGSNDGTGALTES